jgi:hypothetical protein
MALSIRFIPNTGRATIYTNGRQYPASGAVVDMRSQCNRTKHGRSL